MTRSQLVDLAAGGQRTLCLAEREVSEEEWRRWSSVYASARAVADEGRGAAMVAAAADLEQELTLLGATGVEDRLQVQWAA